MIPAVDGRIDFADVNVFTQGWNGDGITFDPIADIGPYTGAQVPNLVAAPDGRLDAYDLLSLSTMYNWYNSTVVAGEPVRPGVRGELDADGPIVAVTRQTEMGWTVELQAREIRALTTAHLIVSLNNSEASILSVADGGFMGSGALFLQTNRGTTAEVCAGRLNREQPEVQGSGTLAVLRMASDSDTPPQLSIEYELRNGTNEIVANGSVNHVIAVEVPQSFGLSNPYPNPFNSTTTFSLQLPEAGRVSLRLFNTLGQEVAEILAADLPAGVHEIRWNAENNSGSVLPTGLYFARLDWNGKSDVSKVMLLK
jgi:hypothetical protein